MGKLIKNVWGRNLVEFDTGVFDNWCIYLTRRNNCRYAPTDKEYFLILADLAGKHGSNKIYNDFVKIFDRTNGNIETDVLTLITDIAVTYGRNAEEMDVWFTVVYAGMVAEENKEFAKLGKRVKRLGMHQILIQGMKPVEAANFSKGMKWRNLDEIMKKNGF